MGQKRGHSRFVDFFFALSTPVIASLLPPPQRRHFVSKNEDYPESQTHEPQRCAFQQFSSNSVKTQWR
jgi:hypothetical protein